MRYCTVLVRNRMVHRKQAFKYSMHHSTSTLPPHTLSQLARSTPTSQLFLFQLELPPSYEQQRDRGAFYCVRVPRDVLGWAFGDYAISLKFKE